MHAAMQSVVRVVKILIMYIYLLERSKRQKSEAN